MISKALAAITATLVLGFTLVWMWPSSPVAAPVVLPTIPAMSLPACHSEDGSGQALCWWDASEQGNGMGMDAVSGECAVGSVGITDEAVSALCAQVWSVPAYTREVGNNGATDSWDGPGMVHECTDIEQQAMQDESIRESLNNDGWNITECFEAMLSE
jgi:hypothetical protein